ncbi:hypothetical protein UCDDA912_g10746 [Diaporthe ampelina]|uniref:Uncharacterized protein n=1 Tax=Diaporthe ampelina TaxID=1214573 RepID=A0A0G2HM35_9PEZI|nr:hypothetical protein UCDDA912_g10746 [Diaporthe ampelina]
MILSLIHRQILRLALSLALSDLDEDGVVILEPQSDADLMGVDAEIEHFEEANGVDLFDEDVELDKLYNGTLHPAEH